MSWTVDWETEAGFGFVQVAVPGFGDVKVTIFPVRPGDLAPKTLLTLDDLRALPGSEVTRLSELLWADCLDAFGRVSYGNDEPVEPAERVEFLKREFAIFGPGDALKASALRGITIPEDELQEQGYRGRYALFSLDAPWCDLPQGVLRDGGFVGVRENGCWIGEFERESTS